MNKKTIIASLIALAEELDNQGLYEDSEQLTKVAEELLNEE